MDDAKKLLRMRKDTARALHGEVLARPNGFDFSPFSSSYTHINKHTLSIRAVK